jgi:hypothetical protein
VFFTSSRISPFLTINRSAVNPPTFVVVSGPVWYAAAVGKAAGTCPRTDCFSAGAAACGASAKSMAGALVGAGAMGAAAWAPHATRRIIVAMIINRKIFACVFMVSSR